MHMGASVTDDQLQVFTGCQMLVSTSGPGCSTEARVQKIYTAAYTIKVHAREQSALVGVRTKDAFGDQSIRVQATQSRTIFQKSESCHSCQAIAPPFEVDAHTRTHEGCLFGFNSGFIQVSLKYAPLPSPFRVVDALTALRPTPSEEVSLGITRRRRRWRRRF